MSAEEKPKGGRPRGSYDKLAVKIREQAMKTGLLPHEILLDMARGNPQKVQQVETDPDTGEVVNVVDKWESISVEEQRDAAKAAAPYYAPKISTVEVISGVSDADLDEFIARAASEAGISIGAGGEGAPGEGEQEQGAAAAVPGVRRVRLKQW